MLVYHFEMYKKREYLDGLRDLLNNSIILLNNEDCYCMANIIYALFEMKRKLLKSNDNPNYRLQVQDLTDSIQLKQIANRLLTQDVINSLKQSRQYQSIWLYLSKFLCAWMLLLIKSNRILSKIDKIEDKQQRQYLMQKRKQDIEEKEVIIRQSYIKTSQIFASVLLDNSIKLDQKEYLQIIYNMKTIDYKMANVSHQHEKNYLFLQQILMKWQFIDQIYLPQSPRNIQLNYPGEEEIQNQQNKQPTPEDFNKIFTQKINAKLDKYSLETARSVLGVLDQYRSTQEKKKVTHNNNNHVHTLNKIKSTHLNRESAIEQVDQNPKIQVFDSDQLLQVEILVSSKNIPLDESINYQVDTKEGADILIRNIIQNELSDKNKFSIQYFQFPNIYEIEEMMIENKLIQGNKAHNIEDLFHAPTYQDNLDQKNLLKDVTQTQFLQKPKKEITEQSQQQKKIAEGVDKLLQKWKNTSQNKFLNYKVSNSQQQQMLRIIQKNQSQAKVQDHKLLSRQNQQQLQTTGNSFTQNTQENTLTSRQYQSVIQLDLKKNKPIPSQNKKEELYFAYSARPFSAKQRKLVSQSSNHYLTQSTGKTYIKSLQELSQVYKEDKNIFINKQNNDIPEIQDPYEIVTQKKQNVDDQEKVIKDKKISMNIFQKVISNHPSHPFILSQKPSDQLEQKNGQFTDKFEPIFQNKNDFKFDHEKGDKLFAQKHQNFITQSTLKPPIISKKINTQTSIEDDKNVKDNNNQSSNNMPTSFSLIPEIQNGGGGIMGVDEFGRKTIFSLRDFDSKEEEWILNGMDSGRDRQSSQMFQQQLQNAQNKQNSGSKNQNIQVCIGSESLSNISSSNKGMSTPFSNRLSINLPNNINSPNLQQNQQELEPQPNQIVEIAPENITSQFNPKTQFSKFGKKKSVPLLNFEKLNNFFKNDKTQNNSQSTEKEIYHVKSSSNLAKNYYYNYNTNIQMDKQDREGQSLPIQAPQSAKELSYQKISAPHRKLLSNTPIPQNKFPFATQRYENKSIISTSNLLTQRPKSGMVRQSENQFNTHHNRTHKDESLNKLMSMHNLFEGREALKSQAISLGLQKQNQLNTTNSLSKLQTQNSIDSLIQDKPAIHTLIKCQLLENQYEIYENAILTTFKKKNIFGNEVFIQKSKVEVGNPGEQNLKVQNEIQEQPLEENNPSIKTDAAGQQQSNNQNFQTQNSNEQQDPLVIGFKRCESEIEQNVEQTGKGSNKTIPSATPKNHLKMQDDFNGLSAIQENTIDGKSPANNDSQQSVNINQTPNIQNQGKKRMYIIEAIEKKKQNKLKTPSFFSKQKLHNDEGTPVESQNSSGQARYHTSRTIRSTKPVEIIPHKAKLGFQSERATITPQNEEMDSISNSSISISQHYSHSPNQKNTLTFTSKLIQLSNEQQQEEERLKKQQQEILMLSQSLKKSFIESQSQIIGNGGTSSDISSSKSILKMTQLRSSGAFKLSVKNIFEAEEKRKKEDEIRKIKFQQRQSAYLQSSFSQNRGSPKNEEDQSPRNQTNTETQSQQLNPIEFTSSQEIVSEGHMKKMSPYINRIKNEPAIRETSLTIDETKFSKINISINNDLDTPNSQTSYTNRPSRFKQQQEEALRSQDKFQLMITSHTNPNGDNDLSSRNKSISRNQTPKNQIQFQNSRKNSIGYISFTESFEKASNNFINSQGNGSTLVKNSSNFKGSISNQQSIEVQKLKQDDVIVNSPGLQKMKDLYAQKQKDKNLKEIRRKYGKTKLEHLIKLVSALKILLNIQEKKRQEMKCKEILIQCIFMIKSVCLKQIKDKKNYENEGNISSQNNQQNISKMNLPFRFMMPKLGNYPQLVHVNHSYDKNEKSYGLLLKWEYQQSFIPLELSQVQSMPFKHATVWPQYFIAFAAYLVESKIIKNIDLFPFDIYMENQKFSIDFFDITTNKPFDLQQLNALSQKITFEDMILIGYLQDMIMLYMRTRFYFSYELSGYRLFENISPITTMLIEQAKTNIRCIERQIAQKIDFNFNISQATYADYIKQGIKKLQENFDSKMITYSPNFLTSSNFPMIALNTHESSKQGKSSKHPNIIQNPIQPLVIKLHQIFNENSQQIDNLVQTYKQPRHILGFLQKVGTHFIMVDLKMCLQEQLNFNSLKLEKFDTSQISFLIKAKNLTVPLINVDAKEIGANEIVQFFGSLNFLKAIKMFVLRQRFPKIWRRKLLDIFRKFVTFSTAQNKVFDTQQGSQRNFKKNMTQNIIFMPFLPKEDREFFKMSRNIPIINAIDEHNEMADNYENLFAKQFQQIYETNFIQRRDKYEEDDLNVFSNNLVQNQKTGKVDYKDYMSNPIESTIHGYISKEQYEQVESIECKSLLYNQSNQKYYFNPIDEMVKIFSRVNQVFFLKNYQRQNICLLYLQLNLTPEGSFQCIEILLRDVERHSTQRIRIYDIKRCLLIINMLLLSLENKQQTQDILDETNQFNQKTIIHRYVNYPNQISKLRDSIIRRMITEKKKTQGQSIEIRTMVIKNEQIGLRIKDDESILRHLIVRSPRLLNFFNVIQRSYVLKSNELGGRCSVSASFYTIKSPEYNPNQSMLVYLNILPYHLRYQDLQAVDKQSCLYIFEKNNYITENILQCLAQKIISQVFVFRTFLGLQLYFRQIRAPKPVRRKTLLLNSPYKKLAAANKKFLLQTTSSIENAALESQKSGDSLNSRAQSRHENDESMIVSQKGNHHLNLNGPLSTIHSPHSGNLGNYNHSQFQQYHSQMNQSQHHNRMKDKHMKGIKKYEQADPEKDLYQKKKATETLTKIKYVRNKYTKYNFDQSIDKEISKPFLEEIVHQKRIIYQSAKIFNNQFAIVTVMKDLVFDSFCLQIYIPKMSRTIQSNITLTKLVDCSWNFFSQVFKDKFFFFFDNSCYLQLFENYQRFALRCLYMEKEKSNIKNSYNKQNTNNIFELAEPLNKQFMKLKVTDENQSVNFYRIFSTLNMKEISDLDSNEYKTYVNPNAQQVNLASNEPIFNNFMKDILPQSQLFIPNPSFMLGINLFKKKERIIKFLQKAMKRKSEDMSNQQDDLNSLGQPKLMQTLSTDSESKKKIKKSLYSSKKKEEKDCYKIQIHNSKEDSQLDSESDIQQNASYYEKKGISMNDYLGIPFLQDLESSDLDTLSKIAASPRQLSFQLKKNQEFIKAQINQRKSIRISNEMSFEQQSEYHSTSLLPSEKFIQSTNEKENEQPVKRDVKGLWKSIVLKHRLKLIYYKNQKRIFEFFRKENSRKIDKIYQFAALTEHIDTFYINQIQSERLKHLYNYIEIYIWDKIIQQFTTIQAFPDKDNMNQEEVEPYVEKEEVRNNQNNEINENNVKSSIAEEKDDIQQPNDKGKDPHQTYSTYLCIDNGTKLFLRELLHQDYMKIDRNEEFQTTVFVDFIKKTQESNSHDSPKHLIDENQPLTVSKKEKAEAYYFETLPTIGYTESSNHIVYIKHQNLNDQTVQKMRINLREIVNLFIAEGYFKSQTNYANSKLSYAEMKQLCHFIIYKIKTNEFFDIVEIKTTIRNFYYHTQILDPVQKIVLKSVLDVNRKSIKFVVSKLGTFETVSRVLSTQFFETYIPFFQSLLKAKQYNVALGRVSSFYGSKMLVFFYCK